MFLGLMRWCLMISQLQHSFAFLSFLSFFFFFFLSLCTLSTFFSCLPSIASLITEYFTNDYYLPLPHCFLLLVVYYILWERKHGNGRNTPGRHF